MSTSIGAAITTGGGIVRDDARDAAHGPVHDPAHSSTQEVAVVATNVTLTSVLERRLLASEDVTRVAFELAPTAMALISLAPHSFGVIRKGNRALSRFTGRSAAVLIGTELNHLLHPADLGAPLLAPGLTTQTDTGGGDGVQRRFLHSDGSARWGLLNTATIAARGEVTDQMVVTIQDVTWARETIEHLSRAALYDPLTGLANRTLFLDRLQLALTAERRARTGLTVLFLDLDAFKPVNDQHGHAAGDAVLREVARRLVSVMRGEDTVARLGGDEFAVLCPGLRPADLPVVEARLRRSLALPVQVPGGGLVEVGVSIGSACAATEDGSATPGVLLEPSSEQMVAAADAAMYAVKAQRKR